MSNQLTDKVKFVQKVALIHEDKVLILKRSNDSQSRPGAWDLPGGNTEWPDLTQPTGNSHTADIVREVEEETGLKINHEKFNDQSLVLFYTFFEPDIQRYSFNCGWRVLLSNDFDPNSIVISNEHTDQVWISLTELDQYDFGEPIGTYIKTIIRNALQRK